MNEWVIRPYGPEDAIAWKALLAQSNNATLFHDLDFLAYHRQADMIFVIWSRSGGTGSTR